MEDLIFGAIPILGTVGLIYILYNVQVLISNATEKIKDERLRGEIEAAQINLENLVMDTVAELQETDGDQLKHLIAISADEDIADAYKLKLEGLKKIAYNKINKNISSLSKKYLTYVYDNVDDVINTLIESTLRRLKGK